uniref:F-box domain-containing protein n=1 Tax=viral metagenome TaxID=1070528 RepID=A0A6C0C6E8_9ZZZZ
MLSLFRKEYLPHEIFINITKYLDINAIKSLLRTCNEPIYHACQDKNIWIRLLDATYNLQYQKYDAKDIFIGLYKVSKYNSFPPTYPEFKKIIKNRDIKLIKLIMESKIDNKLYPLLINETINMDDTEIALILLNSDMLNHRSMRYRYKVLDNAVRMGNFVVIDTLIRDYNFVYLLYNLMQTCVKYQQYDVMKYLTHSYDISDTIIYNTLFALFHRTRNVFNENHYKMIDLMLKSSATSKILFNETYNIAITGVHYNNIRIVNIALSDPDLLKTIDCCKILWRAMKTNNVYTVMLLLDKVDIKMERTKLECLLCELYVFGIKHLVCGTFDDEKLIEIREYVPQLKYVDILKFVRNDPSFDPSRCIIQIMHAFPTSTNAINQHILNLFGLMTTNHLDILIDLVKEKRYNNIKKSAIKHTIEKIGLREMMIKIRDPCMRDNEGCTKLISTLINDCPGIIGNELCDYVIDYMDDELLCYMLSHDIDLSINYNYIIKKLFTNTILFERSNQIGKLKISFAMIRQLYANDKVKSSLI